MERLTYRRAGDGAVCLRGMTKTNAPETVQKAAELLCRYEETGLEPERVVELAQADQAGRLVVLPVKMRDYVYDVDFEKNRIILSKVAAMFVSITEAFPEGVISLELKAVDGTRPGDMHYVYADDIGETIFLTRKEAEEALRKETENS